MVISVSNNISEASINDFFHNTEIAVLELCNQAELDAVRSSFLNEADEGGEEKNSKFATFISSIKLKIEELARKVTDTIRKQMVKIAGSKLLQSIHKLNKKSQGSDDDIGEFIEEKKKDETYYAMIDKFDSPKYNDCNTVDDYFKASKSTVGEHVEAISTIIFRLNFTKTVFFNKHITDLKKEALKQVKSNEKNKTISKDEAIKQIKRIMNWYTAQIKGCVYNVKVLNNIIIEYSKVYKD